MAKGGVVIKSDDLYEQCGRLQIATQSLGYIAETGDIAIISTWVVNPSGGYPLSSLLSYLIDKVVEE